MEKHGKKYLKSQFDNTVIYHYFSIVQRILSFYDP